MCFTFKKNNKPTKKPVNRFLQDGASAGIRSVQTSTEIKLPKSMERTSEESAPTDNVAARAEFQPVAFWFPNSLPSYI